MILPVILQEWDMHETNSLDAWSEDSPLLEEQQHCEELNHKEQSKGTMTSLRRKMSAKCMCKHCIPGLELNVPHRSEYDGTIFPKFVCISSEA